MLKTVFLLSNERVSGVVNAQNISVFYPLYSIPELHTLGNSPEILTAFRLNFQQYDEL